MCLYSEEELHSTLLEAKRYGWEDLVKSNRPATKIIVSEFAPISFVRRLKDDEDSIVRLASRQRLESNIMSFKVVTSIAGSIVVHVECEN